MIATATGEALLAAIRADPADDLVRLVYADWLEELGDEVRADFIRVQVELCRLLDWAESQEFVPADGPEGRRIKHLRRRQNALWAPIPNPPGHPCQWFHVPGWACYCKQRETALEWTTPDDSIVTADVDRGFVAAVRCPLDAWLEHGPALVRAHPVERVEAADRAPSEGDYSHLDWASLLEDPTLWGWYDSDAEGHPDHLPADVWKALPRGLWGGRARKLYPSPEAARDALSDALLLLAGGGV